MARTPLPTRCHRRPTTFTAAGRVDGTIRLKRYHLGMLQDPAPADTAAIGYKWKGDPIIGMVDSRVTDSGSVPSIEVGV